MEEAFSLKRLYEMPLLNEWLDVDSSVISNEEKKRIEALRVFVKKKYLIGMKPSCLFIF